MTPPRRRNATAKSVKTTVVLPEELWRKAKILAMDERMDLRDVIVNALNAYLETRLRKRGKQ